MNSRTLAKYKARRKLRALLYAEQLGLCYICGTKMHYTGGKEKNLNYYATFEHVIPKSKGGRTVKENLVLTCFICNNTRGNNELPRTSQIDSNGTETPSNDQ